LTGLKLTVRTEGNYGWGRARVERGESTEDDVRFQDDRHESRGKRGGISDEKMQDEKRKGGGVISSGTGGARKAVN